MANTDPPNVSPAADSGSPTESFPPLAERKTLPSGVGWSVRFRARTLKRYVDKLAGSQVFHLPVDLTHDGRVDRLSQGRRFSRDSDQPRTGGWAGL